MLRVLLWLTACLLAASTNPVGGVGTSGGGGGVEDILSGPPVAPVVYGNRPPSPYDPDKIYQCWEVAAISDRAAVACAAKDVCLDFATRTVRLMRPPGRDTAAPAAVVPPQLVKYGFSTTWKVFQEATRNDDDEDEDEDEEVNFIPGVHWLEDVTHADSERWQVGHYLESATMFAQASRMAKLPTPDGALFWGVERGVDSRRVK